METHQNLLPGMSDPNLSRSVTKDEAYSCKKSKRKRNADKSDKLAENQIDLPDTPDQIALEIDIAITLFWIGASRREKARYPAEQEENGNLVSLAFNDELRTGMTKLLHYMRRYNGDGALKYSDVTDFLMEFGLKRVPEWFNGWPNDIMNTISTRPWFKPYQLFEQYTCEYDLWKRCSPDDDEDDFDAFGKLLKKYRFSEKIGGSYTANVEDWAAYDALRELGDIDKKFYVTGRRFLIENPILNHIAHGRFLAPTEWNGSERAMDIAAKLLEKAYGPIYDNSLYICPKCGWTMKRIGSSFQCIKKSCTKVSPLNSELKRTPITANGFPKRLRRGVMLAIAHPGILELQIEKVVKNLGLECEMWPGEIRPDETDLLVKFPKGDVWLVDAKNYENGEQSLLSLRDKLSSSNQELLIPHDKMFYVLPASQSQKNINLILANRTKATCLTITNFEKAMKEHLHE